MAEVEELETYLLGPSDVFFQFFHFSVFFTFLITFVFSRFFFRFSFFSIFFVVFSFIFQFFPSPKTSLSVIVGSNKR